MFLHVTEVKYVEDYTLWVAFNDGTSGYIDLKNRLCGLLFEQLLDVNYFKKAYLDLETHTVSWPGGIDLAPEFLKDNIKITSDHYYDVS